jgi:hypothetical protein
LEAALYARFLGYEVLLLERGVVAEHVRQWGHVPMFSPFSLNRSPLGLAALAAQDASYRPPPDDALLTGGQWRDQYLVPLSQTDLLADGLRTGCRVLSVTRDEFLKRDPPGDPERCEVDFRLLVEHAGERQEELRADVVIDSTGVFSNANWMGPGGGPAIGETWCRARIWYQLPDVLGADAARFAERRTLVVGSGHSAATTVVGLAELQAQHPRTEITWATRRAIDPGRGPLAVLPDDRLPARARLASQANGCVLDGRVRHRAGTWVTAVDYHEPTGPFQVLLAGQEPGPLEVDEIVANVGYRPDTELYRELQIHQCYCTEGPMKLAARLLQEASLDCLDQPAQGAQVLVNPEPDFYILGAKSYGRNPHFLFATGLQQIRELFTLIGDRSDLDLYRGAASLL